MSRKKYIIVFSIVVIILFIATLIAVFNGGIRRNSGYQNNNSLIPTTIIFNNQTYQIEDTSPSPSGTTKVVQGAILRVAQPNNPTRQTFLIKNENDGSLRQLFVYNDQGMTFENIQPQNWSPNNRYVFIFMDYPTRRDVIFLKTDGTFTNAQFYLHSTGLYPDMNILTAKWLTAATLELQSTDNKTQKPITYTVNFDDDTGILSQCPGGPTTCTVR